MRKLLEHRLFRSVAVLVSGTAAAQLVNLLATPFLIRLYGMEQWGYFGAFSSVFLTLVTVAALRFDQAVPLAETNQEARSLVRLGVWMCVVLAALTFAGCLALQPEQARFIGIPVLADYPWLLPLTLLGGGLYIVLSSWHVRLGTYKTIARTTFTQALAMVAVQMGGASVAAFKGFALPLGLGIGRTAGVLSFARSYWSDRESGPSPSLGETFRRHRRFAYFGVPSSLANAAGLQAPAVLLTMLYGPVQAGSYYTSVRVLGLPMVFLGVAVSQVYLSEFGKNLREAPERLRGLFVGSLKRLMLLVPVMALAGFTAPFWFPVVFGPEAVEAGQWSALLTPGYCVGLLCSPLSSTANSLGRQDLQMGLDLLRLVVTVLAFAIPSKMGLPAIHAIVIYAVVVFLMYGVYIWFYDALIRKHRVKIETAEVQA